MNRLLTVLTMAVTLYCIGGCATQPKTAAQIKAEEVIASLDDSTAQRLKEEDAANIIAKLDEFIASRLKKMAEAGKFYTKYTIPSDEQIRKLSKRILGEPEMQDLRTAAEGITRKYEKEIVWPAWAERKVSACMPKAEKLLADSQFEQCREVLWNASTTGVADVDERIRKVTVEFMNVKVNPVQWRIIEKDMRTHAIGFAKRGAWEEGETWLKSVPHVREFSVKLDKQLLTVKKELKNLSVEEADLAPIMAATAKMVGEAAKIYDYTDTTTNAEGQVSASADLVEYEKQLDEYRKTLILHNCTEENADKIIAAFRADADKLLEPLYSVESSSRAFLRLGTGAVNKRIDAFSLRLVKWLANKQELQRQVAELFAAKKFEEAKKLIKEDVEAVAEVPEVVVAKKTRGVEPPPSVVDLVFEGEKFRWEIANRVSQGKYVEAREYIWAKIYPKTETPISAYLKPIGREEMMKTVNPANWAVIESDISNRVAKAVAKDGYSKECCEKTLEWLAAYPRISVYAQEIDARLEGVAREAARLGLNRSLVNGVVVAVKGEASEAARLANHTDTVKQVVLAGRKPNRSQLEKLIEEYRKALIKNDCTEENADKLIKAFREGIEPFFTDLANDVTRDELYLGCNALNDRIGALVARAIDEIKALVAAKEAEIARLKAEAEAQNENDLALARKVIELVLKSKYDEARNLIRDVKLVGKAKFDLNTYRLRVGLLDCVVNPNQLKALCDEIERKLAELYAAEKYEEIIAFTKEYRYVRDEYEDIAASLDMIKASTKGLLIAEVDAETYVGNLSKQIRALLDSREGLYEPPVAGLDTKELDEALAKFDRALLQQWYDVFGVSSKTNVIYHELVKLEGGVKDPLTTAEMNAALKCKISETVLALCMGCKDSKGEMPTAAELAMLAKIQDRDYVKKLAEIDAEISFVSQIAMAEDAIAHQLGIKCPAASLQMNAVLGEYARSMRLLKLEKKLDADLLSSMLVGAVYLDQEAVFKRAIELGADVNAVPSRDPLGRSALLVAIQLGRGDFVKELGKTASATMVDKAGNTALHYAVVRGNVSMVKSMLGKTSVNAVNASGESAVFEAARKNQAGIVAVLAAAKDFNVAIVSKIGLTAFDVACDAGSRDVLDPLAQAKAVYGASHLAIAAKKDHIGVAQWLIEHGVDVNGTGVMKAAVEEALALGRVGKPFETYKYLVRQGGVGDSVCEILAREKIESEKQAAVQAAKDEADKEARRKADEGVQGKVKVILEK